MMEDGYAICTMCLFRVNIHINLKTVQGERDQRTIQGQFLLLNIRSTPITFIHILLTQIPSAADCCYIVLSIRPGWLESFLCVTVPPSAFIQLSVDSAYLHHGGRFSFHAFLLKLHISLAFNSFWDYNSGSCPGAALAFVYLGPGDR